MRLLGCSPCGCMGWVHACKLAGQGQAHASGARCLRRAARTCTNQSMSVSSLNGAPRRFCMRTYRSPAHVRPHRMRHQSVRLCSLTAAAAAHQLHASQ